MNRLYKLIFVYTFLVATPLVQAQESLYQTNAELIQEACDIMQQTASIQQYWQETNHSTFKRFMTTLPHRWFDQKWKTETPLKADLLQALFDKIATFLGSIQDPEETAHVWFDLKNEALTILESCAIPSRLERNWATCTIGSLALIALYARTKQTLNTKTLFDIEGEFKDLVTGIPNSPTTYLSHYQYAQRDGRSYLEVVNNDADHVRQYLGGRIYTERTPGIADLRNHLYNEDGRTHVAHWAQEHCVKPFKNLYEILFKDLKQDPERDILRANAPKSSVIFTNECSLWIEDARVNPNQEIRDCIEKSLAGRSVASLKLEELKSIKTDFIVYILTNNNRLLNEYLAYMSHQTSSRFTQTFFLGSSPTNDAQAKFDIIGRALGLESLEKLFKGDNIGDLIRSFTNQQLLTFGTMAIMPAFVAGYLTYKGTTGIVQRIAKRTFITPLKQDLLSLQVTLNSHSHRDALDAHTKGLCMYWTMRLDSYLKKMSAKERPRYALYMEHLKNHTLSAQQKIQIIECMFKEFSFLK